MSLVNCHSGKQCRSHVIQTSQRQGYEEYSGAEGVKGLKRC